MFWLTELAAVANLSYCTIMYARVSNLGEYPPVLEYDAANANWQAGHDDVAVAGAKEIER